MEFYFDNRLYVKITEQKGRGIFTRGFISAGSILECAPVVVMTNEERALLDKTLLHDYIFEWDGNEGMGCCMALGYIPVYNHSYTSNCEYFMDYDTDTITIKAVKDINIGEEVTINYNGDWDDAKPVWFETTDR